MPCTILTLPLHANIGGLLQAYALQQACNSIDLPTHLSHYYIHPITCANWEKKKNLKALIQLILKRYPEKSRLPPWILRHIYHPFIKKYLTYTKFTSPHTLKTNVPTAEPWIVGSDQIWRLTYTRCIAPAPFFFLEFAPDTIRRQSIAYAASFGTDEWEGSPEETNACARLLQQFKAVSVRERSALDICRKQFGVDAVQMPDPTLLLRKQDYNQIIRSNHVRIRKQPYIATYILDQTPEKSASINQVALQLGIPVQPLQPQYHSCNWHHRLPPSVPQWLHDIREAQYVITDSFHGCVFSIIFHKPFVCFGNSGRGSARFDSLTQVFQLESRIANSYSDIFDILCDPIDWDKIQTIHDQERTRGIQFLKDNLCP